MWPPPIVPMISPAPLSLQTMTGDAGQERLDRHETEDLVSGRVGDDISGREGVETVLAPQQAELTDARVRGDRGRRSPRTACRCRRSRGAHRDGRSVRTRASAPRPPCAASAWRAAARLVRRRSREPRGSALPSGGGSNSRSSIGLGRSRDARCRNAEPCDLSPFGLGHREHARGALEKPAPDRGVEQTLREEAALDDRCRAVRRHDVGHAGRGQRPRGDRRPAGCGTRAGVRRRHPRRAVAQVAQRSPSGVKNCQW